MKKKTLIISGFACIGKQYLFDNYNDKYSILYPDIMHFRYRYRKRTQEELNEEKKIWESKPHLLSGDQYINQIKDQRWLFEDENFPNNYVNYVKKNIGKFDIILTSYTPTIRKAMSDSGINYITVYPNKSLLHEYVGRMYIKGYDRAGIDAMISHWDSMIDGVENEPHGEDIYYFGPNMFLSNNIEYLIRKYVKQNIRRGKL